MKKSSALHTRPNSGGAYMHAESNGPIFKWSIHYLEYQPTDKITHDGGNANSSMLAWKIMQKTFSKDLCL